MLAFIVRIYHDARSSECQTASFIRNIGTLHGSGSFQGPATSTLSVTIDQESGWASEPVQELLEKTKAVPPSGELLNKALADPNVCLCSMIHRVVAQSSNLIRGTHTSDSAVHLRIVLFCANRLLILPHKKPRSM